MTRDIIVMGFGDAAAYLEPGSELVRNGIAVALCAMLRQAADRRLAWGRKRLSDSRIWFYRSAGHCR